MGSLVFTATVVAAATLHYYDFSALPTLVAIFGSYGAGYLDGSDQ